MMYTYGLLKKGWAAHVLEIDHRHGAWNQLAYGRTLCGRKGRISNPEDYDSLSRIILRVFGLKSLCRSCLRTLRGRNL